MLSQPPPTCTQCILSPKMYLYLAAKATQSVCVCSSLGYPCPCMLSMAMCREALTHHPKDGVTPHLHQPVGNVHTQLRAHVRRRLGVCASHKNANTCRHQISYSPWQEAGGEEGVKIQQPPPRACRGMRHPALEMQGVLVQVVNGNEGHCDTLFQLHVCCQHFP